MLHDLETLTGAAVIATDGEMGSVRNFLFDELSWTIRYLVVDVGNWLTRRAVVIAITAVKHPDWVKKTFHVGVTKEQCVIAPMSLREASFTPTGNRNAGALRLADLLGG